MIGSELALISTSREFALPKWMHCKKRHPSIRFIWMRFSMLLPDMAWFICVFSYFGWSHSSHLTNLGFQHLLITACNREIIIARGAGQQQSAHHGVSYAQQQQPPVQQSPQYQQQQRLSQQYNNVQPANSVWLAPHVKIEFEFDERSQSYNLFISSYPIPYCYRI